MNFLRSWVNLSQIICIKWQSAHIYNHFYKVISLEMKCRCIDTTAEAVGVIERYESIIGDGVENFIKSSPG